MQVLTVALAFVFRREISHPYPYPYLQIFRGYPWISMDIGGLSISTDAYPAYLQPQNFHKMEQCKSVHSLKIIYISFWKLLKISKSRKQTHISIKISTVV